MGNFLRSLGRYGKHRYAVFILSIWLVFLMEWLSRGNLGDTFSWCFSHIGQLLFNGLLTFGLIMACLALIGRVKWAYWIVSVPLLVLGLISGTKQKILGVPLLPWDFVLTSETSDMAQYVKNILNVNVIGAIIAYLVVSYLILRTLPKLRAKAFWKERAALAVAAVALLAVIYVDKPVDVKRSLFGIGNMPWNQTDNMKTNGFALSTYMNLEYLFVKQMSEYDSAKIDEILNQASKPAIANAENGVKPNVIVVLSESFFDATQLPGVTFSRDPLPFFHALQKKTSSGTILSPQFGGGTANVEFEVLTGNSMRFLPQGSIAYNQYIDHEVDSLASILGRQGYTSTAISPFHNWYFNANKVYKNFGFGKYQSIEFFNPVYEGPYIADSEVANMIINESKKSSGPDFIFANTMENHFHYYPGKFKKNTIDVKADVSAESIGFLETYAQGLIDVDKMLQSMVEYYSSISEPTILVFFGDHLPSLGDDYKVYRETKLISGEDDPDFLNKMHRTPVLVWNNYLPEKKDTLDMSPSFISPYVLDLAKLPGTYYTDFLHNLWKKSPVIPPKNYYEKMNISVEDMKQYEYLQYDIIFGERHGYKDFKDKIVNPNFTLGNGPMSIDRLTPDVVTAGGGKTKITVSGKNFSHGSVVYVGGKPQPTTYVSETELFAELPAELTAKAGTLDLDIRVIDNKNEVISQSNGQKLQVNAK
ncbi:sulfatase-like hydrolase/transferase [Paenibacillus sp. MBLB4367]|uniref:sulfatase-like hydrolase/transferase n=1 Tax=Paenibacillus sp. MBLB4367 TaxID=3384767 RepID=UPI003907FD95